MIILFVILIASFFRFYLFREFQYWSGDEEVLTATLRHIIWDRSPTLLVQNANLGFGLGPFYHYFLTPFYFLTNFDLVKLQAIASVLGMVTTYLVYLGGQEIKGRKLGLIAAFLYASSFFISLFERRVFHLTLDPVIAALTFLSLAKVVRRDYRFIPMLAIPIGFSFHADASLMVLVMAIITAWIHFRFPLRNKYFLYGLLILIIFIMPLSLAQIHYKGAVVGPMINSLRRRWEGGKVLKLNLDIYQPADFIKVLSRVIFTVPSKFIEEHLSYDRYHALPLFSPITEILVIFVLIVSFSLLFKKRPYRRAMTILLWIMTTSFILGIFLYTQLFRAGFCQHYFMVFFPIFILILAQVIFLLYQRFRLIFFIILFFYFTVNLLTLVNSAVRYPLYKKIELVKSSLKSIGNRQFSLYASYDPYIHGGGWTELYTLEKQPAVKSYWYDSWEWIYKAYSLFPGPHQEKDPQKIVLVFKEQEKIGDIKGIVDERREIATYRFKDIKISVFENLEREAR